MAHSPTINRKHKTRLFVIAALAVSAMLALVFSRWSNLASLESSFDVPQESEAQVIRVIPAPDLMMETLDGEPFQLSEYRGRLILLNFWASWCVPCIAEFPSMIEFANTYREEAVIIAVSVDQERGNITEFLGRVAPDGLPQNFLIVHDPDKAISKDQFQTIRYPETVVINGAFELQDKIIGATDWQRFQVSEGRLAAKE